jgi:uncharacterized 2Fe-2S/4Fe-4S cluster protein (DUF4445 family)
MMHLFLNVDPCGMGEAPFMPVFLDEKIVEGEKLSLSVETVYLLPSISSFVGADITSGLASLDILNREGTSFFIDLGTNAEMALVNRGKIFCCSAAAGPAFEGDSISGSVLIDAICEMIKQGVIDETGLFKNGEKSFLTARGISVTTKDIRDYVLAKSAVISGINLLCKKENLSFCDIKNIFIAGGFGLRLNQKSAITAGLLPKEFIDKISVMGNLSIKGSAEYLSDKNFAQKCKNIIEKCTVIDLAGDPSFADEFVANLLFTF